jgi:hypothetical protein
MNKSPITQIHPDVPIEPTRLKEHQITGHQLAFGHAFAELGLFPGCARYLHAEYVTKGELHECRAIYSSA